MEKTINIYKEFGLKEVINANGKMTVLGASVVAPKIADYMKSALQNFVIMDDLMNYTGDIIAQKTTAEAACPTCGAASGVAIAVAASIAGENLTLIEQIPMVQDIPKEIIIQKGQVINFGGNLAQMIMLGGGVPIEVGCSNKVAAELIENAINKNTAALMYVKSHHAVQKGMQPLDVMIEIAHKHNLPIIVDAAAEENLTKYVNAEVDMVIYSGGKAINGPTSGFIAGKSSSIRACKKQYQGIGRAMKVSKEAMIGLITSINNYQKESLDAKSQIQDMQLACDALSKIDGVYCQVKQDESGREIYRAEIQIKTHESGISAITLNDKLKKGNPAIYLREYYVEQGVLSIDPRPLFRGQLEIIIERIICILEGK